MDYEKENLKSYIINFMNEFFSSYNNEYSYSKNIFLYEDFENVYKDFVTEIISYVIDTEDLVTLSISAHSSKNNIFMRISNLVGPNSTKYTLLISYIPDTWPEIEIFCNFYVKIDRNSKSILKAKVVVDNSEDEELVKKIITHKIRHLL